MIEVKRTTHKGLGVFATQGIPAGTLISEAAFTAFPSGALKGTPIDDNTIWHKDGECIVWGIAPLINHDEDPNCGFEWTETTHKVIAQRDIEMGEELSIDYDVPLWFNPVAEECDPSLGDDPWCRKHDQLLSKCTGRGK